MLESMWLFKEEIISFNSNHRFLVGTEKYKFNKGSMKQHYYGHTKLFEKISNFHDNM